MLIVTKVKDGFVARNDGISLSCDGTLQDTVIRLVLQDLKLDLRMGHLCQIAKKYSHTRQFLTIMAEFIGQYG